MHPDRIFRKGGARVGDALVLSKPLGTGLALAAGDDGARSAAIAGMRRLNRAASEALQSWGSAVHGVTDVTGYGLAGHGWEMAERSGATFAVEASRLPLYPGVAEAAARGVRTGGDRRNRDAVERHVTVDPTVSDEWSAVLFDPQTSGGLLAAVDPSVVDAAVAAGFVVVGEVRAGAPRVALVP